MSVRLVFWATLHIFFYIGIEIHFLKMRKASFLFPTMLCLLLATWSMNAQKASSQDTPQTAKVTEEDDGPILTKFEPDFQNSNKERMADIRHKRAILDTMDLSDRKRRRLLKDLYKNGVSERLQKVLMTDTKFEDIE